MSSLQFPRVLSRKLSSRHPRHDERFGKSSARVEFFDVSPYFITGLLSRNRICTFKLSNSVGRVSTSRKFSSTCDVTYRIALRRMYTRQSPVHRTRRTRQKSRDTCEISHTPSTLSTRLKVVGCFATTCFSVANFSTNPPPPSLSL